MSALKDYADFLLKYKNFKKVQKENESKELYGVTGSYGPNDGAYINNAVREAAQLIKRAQELYSQGHYNHSNARVISKDNPLSIALFALKVEDEQDCVYANREHDEKIFTDYQPMIEDQTRWDAGGYMQSMLTKPKP